MEERSLLDRDERKGPRACGKNYRERGLLFSSVERTRIVVTVQCSVVQWKSFHKIFDFPPRADRPPDAHVAMSKRGVTFTKPEEPSFLRRLKEQVGYKEGPTVDTKREDLDLATEEDFEDTAEEQPTVVVLQPGDLSAEEATRVQKQLEKEAEETPADLSVPVVFKAPSKDKKPSDKPASKRSSESQDSKKKSKKPKTKALLSFDDEEEEGDD